MSCTDFCMWLRTDGQVSVFRKRMSSCLSSISCRGCSFSEAASCGHVSSALSQSLFCLISHVSVFSSILLLRLEIRHHDAFYACPFCYMITLVIWRGPLCFHINFKIVFTSSVKKHHWHFKETAPNLQAALSDEAKICSRSLSLPAYAAFSLFRSGPPSVGKGVNISWGQS